jgi:hypothetical protein
MNASTTAPLWPFRWPVVNSGPSWSLPRVSMPDILSIQWDFSLDTWFYGGYATDSEGRHYSVNLYFGRNNDPENPLVQFVTLGVGIGDGETGIYHHCNGNGVGCSESALLPSALTVPRATDSSFQLSFLGGMAGPTGSMTYTGGEPVGMAGALYAAQVDGLSVAGEMMSLTLAITDGLGTRMEGHSGYVGPLKQGDGGLYTYEIAQPRLVITGGSLILGTKVVTLTAGNLWHDRQTYTVPPPEAQTAAQTAAPKPLAPLYRGNWVTLYFNSGLTASLNVGWPEPEPGAKQWISGRAVGVPPGDGSSGNLYFADGVDRYNGGAFLNGGGEGDEWDYDINIFNPACKDDPSQHSPHWQSSFGPGFNTYCTKWSVAFSDRLAHWNVPPMIYLVALVDGCEFTSTVGDCFWEGAVQIFSDHDCTQSIGFGFYEQMGYN